MVARLETTKTRSHKGTKKRKSFEILGVLSIFVVIEVGYVSSYIESLSNLYVTVQPGPLPKLATTCRSCLE